MTTIRAAIYARVSTKSQAGEDKVSIPDQLRVCKEFIERQGWEFAGEYVDPGISASEVNRPGLNRLFTAKEKWDALVVWDFDRLSREKRSVGEYIFETLDESKKQVTSVKQPIPIDDPQIYDPKENDTPFMVRNLAGFTSGMDNRRRFRTLRKGIKEKIAQGYMISKLPYGYRINIKVEGSKITKLPRTPDPEKASIIRRIFNEYRKGKSYIGIARDLIRDGIPGPRGTYWSRTTIREMIQNPIYCGKLRTNYVVQLSRSKWHCNSPDQWKITQGLHEPIISEDLWNEVQEVRRRKQRMCRAISSPRILSGLVYCGLCGMLMRKEGNWKGGYYTCNTYRIRGTCQRNIYHCAKLEHDVLENIFRIAEDKNVFDMLQQTTARSRNDELRAEIARSEKILADIPGRINKIYTLYETEIITQEEFQKRKTELNEIESNMRRVILDKNMELQKLRGSQMSREAFTAALRILKDEFQKDNVPEKKAALATIIDRIDVVNKSFKISYRHVHLTAD